MGKALVINGLVVNNPLCVVSIETSPLEIALKKYYAANNTINSEEKTALEALVQGLMDANLWGKFKYFYPMLGGTVDDMLIDVINPTDNDLLGLTTKEGLSIENRNIYALNRKNTEHMISDRAASLNLSDITFISNSNANNTGHHAVLLMSGSNKFGLVDCEANGFRYPVMKLYGMEVPNSTEASEVLNRNRTVMGIYKDGVCSVYNDNELYFSKQIEVSAKVINYARVLNTIRTNEVDKVRFGIVAIAEGFTQEEASAAYNVIERYLVTLGRR